MKKNFVLIICLFMSFSTFAQTQPEKEKPDFSHWSITLEAGINRFDGDVKQDYGREVIPTADSRLTLGGALEYTISPAWSLGLDYYYLALSGSNKPNGVGYAFDTKMNNVSFFTSFNPIRAFVPWSKTKWGIWGGVGVGYSMHKVNYVTDNDDGDPSTPPVQVPTKWGSFPDENYSNDKGRAMFIPVHLLIEYNFTKSIAFGIKTQYRGFLVDDIDGRFRPNANDALEFATLQLRLKLGAQSKDHTRNLLPAAESQVTKDDLLNLQNQIDGIIIPEYPFDDLDGRLRKLENYLDIDGPDDDNDGVANSRDLEPNTPAGNQVDFWGRTIQKNDQNNYEIDPNAFIHFDFDKTDLDEEAKLAVKIAAQKLQENPNLLIEVRGYTDNMGSDQYNAGLSQRRADKVKNELIKVYGIDANRIIANGKGKYNPDDKVIRFRPYRTCILFYSE